MVSDKKFHRAFRTHTTLFINKTHKRNFSFSPFTKTKTLALIKNFYLHNFILFWILTNLFEEILCNEQSCIHVCIKYVFILRLLVVLQIQWKLDINRSDITKYLIITNYFPGPNDISFVLYCLWTTDIPKYLIYL